MLLLHKLQLPNNNWIDLIYWLDTNNKIMTSFSDISHFQENKKNTSMFQLANLLLIGFIEMVHLPMVLRHNINQLMHLTFCWLLLLNKRELI